MNDKMSSKRRSKLMAASAIALTLTISGGLLSGNSAFAATSGSTSTKQAQAPKAGGQAGHRGGGMTILKGYEDKLAAYLNLDAASLKEKLQTESLAEIAESQGVSSDNLKSQLVSWMQEALAARSGSSSAGSSDSTSNIRKAPDFSTLADKLLDSKGGDILKGGFGGRGKGMALNEDKLASLLGLTADELKQAQQAGETLAQAGADQGISRETLKEKLVAWIEENKPASDSAARSDSATDANRPAFDASAWADKLLDSAIGGRGGEGKIGAGLGVDTEAIATALGLTADELRTALASGETIAEEAGKLGVDVQTVIDALTASLQKNLSDKLSAGKITQGQYDSAVANLTSRAEAVVNGQARDGHAAFGKKASKNGAQGDSSAKNSTADDSSAE
ncbi:hypothetical protein [Cohnella zeiphila]|uniref:Uncharacterized protein n=1 Tax=Cohnella zeiphila TaxID=2761120 RepID=A0A7X0SPY0_9BACL|nr:hypothetical protein [Cohnella zeiphila]MBB6734012.1 hypothetical protein [Cohnella zeiphila]